MVSWFPSLKQDEILYSGLARYAEVCSYTDPRFVMLDLFGKETVSAVIALPSNLNSLVAHLPRGSRITADELIDYHTLFPLYRLTLSPDQLRHVRHDMAMNHGSSVYMRTGAMAGRLPISNELRFCSECMHNDVELHGEPYWHRSHQIPSITVCAVHGIILETGFSLRAASSKQCLVPLRRAVRLIPKATYFNPCDEVDSLHFALAQDLSVLLDSHTPDRASAFLHARYRSVLKAKGLMSPTGRIKTREVIRQFIEFFPPDFLKQLNCYFGSDVQDNWLLRLLRKPRAAQSIIQHILVMHFLGYRASEFLKLPNSEDQPFGDGPWPCLNHACPHYNLNVISDCVVTYHLQIPTGTFACPHCSFTYSRSGPDPTGMSKNRIGKILNVGPIWLNALDRLTITPNISLRAKARELGVSPRTVIRYQRAVHSSKSNTVHWPNQMANDWYREQWATKMREYPSEGTKFIRMLIPSVYTWLYRHDREWLIENKPQRVVAVRSDQRVDWKTRDFEICQRIPSAVETLRNQSEPAAQVTIAAVGRLLGVLALLQKHLDKMPNVASALDTVVEDRYTFGIRRIDIAVKHFQTSQMNPKLWELVRRAGVIRLLEDTRIQVALEEAMEILEAI